MCWAWRLTSPTCLALQTSYIPALCPNCFCMVRAPLGKARRLPQRIISYCLVRLSTGRLVFCSWEGRRMDSLCSFLKDWEWNLVHNRTHRTLSQRVRTLRSVSLFVTTEFTGLHIAELKSIIFSRRPGPDPVFDILLYRFDTLRAGEVR